MPTDQKILEIVQECEDRTKYLRTAHEREWYRNLLYKQGIQWIIYDEVSKQFRHKKLKSWIPTPVTNRYASTLEALVALILRVEPTLQWTAEDQSDEEEKAVAEAATRFVERAKQITHFHEWRQELASWLVYTGNVFLINVYDPTNGSKLTVPYYQCQLCLHEALPSSFEDGKCASCHAPMDTMEYAITDQGTPKEETFRTGEVRTEIGSPFEMFYDYSTTQWHDQHEILREKSRPLHYFPQRYGSKGKKVEASGSYTLSEFYSSTLAYAASGQTLGAGTTQAMRKTGATEKWYARRPDDEFPNGLMVVVAGETILEKSDLEPRDMAGERFLPVARFIMDPIPGSALGKTIANDLAPKQKQRNELESLIQLITMRMANPVWIVPYGTNVEGFSGQPGAVLKVMQLLPNATSRPERLPGENVPASVMKWLEQLDKDFEELASVFDVLKGSAPTGISAGYALQLLIERGQSRWGPLFQRWENGHIMWATQVTCMARGYMPIEVIEKILGQHGKWQAQKFKEDDMTGFEMKVEAGSSTPHSALGENALIDTSIGQGLIDLADPANKADVLRARGLSRFDRQSDWDIQDAKREEEGFLLVARAYLQVGEPQQQMPQMPGMPPQVPPEQLEILQSGFRFRPQVDNHPIHIWSHTRFAKTDDFLKLPAQWQAAWLEHLGQHAMVVMQQAQQQMMMSGGGPQDADGGPPKNGGPPKSNNSPPGQPGEEVPSPGGGVEPNVAASRHGGHRPNPALQPTG